MTLEGIDLTTIEGRFLWAAVVELTTRLHTDKTPNQVMDLLRKIVLDNKKAFPRKKTLWGEDAEDCDEFFVKITKNAGPRDL